MALAHKASARAAPAMNSRTTSAIVRRRSILCSNRTDMVYGPQNGRCVAWAISAESRRDFIENRGPPPGLATAKTIDERPICWEHVQDLGRQITGAVVDGQEAASSEVEQPDEAKAPAAETDALTPSAIAGNNGSRWAFEYCKLLLPGDGLSMEVLL